MGRSRPLALVMLVLLLGVGVGFYVQQRNAAMRLRASGRAACERINVIRHAVVINTFVLAASAEVLAVYARAPETRAHFRKAAPRLWRSLLAQKPQPPRLRVPGHPFRTNCKLAFP